MESIHKINVEILISALTFYANKTKRNIAYQHKWLSDSQSLDFLSDSTPLVDDNGKTIGFERVVTNILSVPNRRIKDDIEKFEFIIAVKYVIQQSSKCDGIDDIPPDKLLNSYIELTMIDTYNANGTFVLVEFEPTFTISSKHMDNLERIECIEINGVPMITHNGKIKNLMSNDLDITNADIELIADTIVTMSMNTVNYYSNY